MYVPSGSCYLVITPHVTWLSPHITWLSPHVTWLSPHVPCHLVIAPCHLVITPNPTRPAPSSSWRRGAAMRAARRCASVPSTRPS